MSRDVYDIFETTGFTELLDVKKALRKVIGLEYELSKRVPCRYKNKDRFRRNEAVLLF